MSRYKDLLYKHQTDLRGLKEPDELIRAFAKTAKWYKHRLKRFLPKDPFAEILQNLIAKYKKKACGVRC